MSKKIYAVRKGIKTGIFYTWAECQQAINGYSGAEYKSFSNEEDARAYLRNEDITKKHTKKAQEDSILNDTLIAYIDGSYDKDLARYSFGCVLLTPKGDIIEKSGCGDDPEAVLLNNVAGELLGAIFVCKWAINNGYTKIEIRHDYEGIEKWALDEWKAKNNITKLYKTEMENFKKELIISFKKVDAHTNDTLNDKADKLAKQALSDGKKATVNKGENWYTVRGIDSTQLKSIIELVIEEISNINLIEKDIAYGKRFELVLAKKEKLIIQHYPDKNILHIQGKFQKLFSVFVSYITELVEIDNIPEFFNNFFKLEIDRENVKTEFKTLLPNAVGKLPPKLNTYLHQAVYNLNIYGDVFDATFLTEPALRGMDGHLKNVLKNNGISLRESDNDKQDRYYMFERDGSRYKLKNEYTTSLSDKLVEYIGKCYTYFHNNRHGLSHWDDPTLDIDTTRMTRNVNDAHMIIRNTLSIINEYYDII